jgi:hypothetical protein
MPFTKVGSPERGNVRLEGQDWDMDPRKGESVGGDDTELDVDADDDEAEERGPEETL